MATASKIIHPRFYRSNRLLYRLRCTIQESRETQLDSGEVCDIWCDVDGLCELPCIFSNPSELGAARQVERQLSDHAQVIQQYLLSFDRAYPNIELGMRAIVTIFDNGVDCPAVNTYDIIDIDFDSQSTVTRLRLQKVSA